jgi:hypothetical protein
MDIVLGSSWTPEYRRLGQLTFFQNKVPYAKAHGYGNYFYQHDAGIHIKQVMFDRVLWDWFFFSGCDAMITRPDIKLESFLRADCDFIGCLMHLRVFGDAWFMRCCDPCKWMLDAMMSNKLWGETEQEAFPMYLSSRRWPEHKAAMPGNFLDESFCVEAERQLSKNNLRMGVIRLGQKFVADDARLWGGNVPWIEGASLPEVFSWHSDTFMLHMGGKDLAFRLAEMPKYVVKNPGLCSG